MPRFWPVGLLLCLASSLLAFFGSSSGFLRTLLLAYWSSDLLAGFFADFAVRTSMAIWIFSFTAYFVFG
jgi:hypothetical protein